MPLCIGYIYQTTTIQQSMKLKDILQDSMLIVGCIVGVSFVTGKEAQVFVGNGQNIALFAVIFALCAFVLRQFCGKRQVASTQQFCQFVFGKCGHVLHFALLACYFVCLVTTLATVESSFCQLVGKLPFPAWSAVVVTLSAVAAKGGTKSFKALSTMAFVGAFVTFLLVSQTGVGAYELEISPLSTALYSLFSVTMVLPVCCKMTKKSTWENILCVVVATAIVSALLWWVERIADFSLQLPIGGKLTGAGKVCLCLTVGLCGMSGAVGNALPICEGLVDIVADKKLLAFVVFGLGWAFSCLGLDILLKYGYLFVAVVGLVVIVRCLVNKKSPLPR